MNAPEPRDLDDLLRGAPQPPPADLASRIKDEIPETFGRRSGGAPPARRSAARWWSAAAAVAIAVVGAFLAVRSRELVERAPSAAEQERPAAAKAAERTPVGTSDLAVGEAAPAEAEPAPPTAQRLATADDESTDDFAAVEPASPPSAHTPAATTPPAAPAAAAEPAEARSEERSAGADASVETDATEVRLETLGSVVAEISPPPAPVEPPPRVPEAKEDAVRQAAPPPVWVGKSTELRRRSDPRTTARQESPKPVARKLAEENARIEPKNRRIDALEAESRRLERELEALEASAQGSRPGSTGGTAEPNDAPYGDVFFRSPGVNPFIDTDDDPRSTFGLEVDTASYTIVRRYLDDGHLPPPEAVRVEELLNAFDYGDAPPAGGEDFALYAEAGPAPFGEGPAYRLVRFGLRARVVEADDRPPTDLVFVVDTSGSMARGDRLDLVIRSLGLLLAELGPDDRVGLVTYGDHAEVRLAPTADRGAVRRALGRLAPSGSTNAAEGLERAYELAARWRREGAVSRLVLCSDGVANVGRTSAESILARVGGYAASGIELTAVGFGTDNYNDVLLEQLADRGNGRYAYVDTLDEARRIFVESLTGTLLTVAGDAKAQVEFDPATVSRYRLLGYENRAIADERFRDDTVDAGEIGAGHAVVALYEIKLAGEIEPGAPIATLRLRYRPAAGGETVERERTLHSGEVARRWEAASPSLRLAAIVAELAEILRGSYWARGGDLADLHRRAAALAAERPQEAKLAELAELVGRAARIAGRDGR